jgi:predicted metal-dependent hydrolase
MADSPDSTEYPAPRPGRDNPPLVLILGHSVLLREALQRNGAGYRLHFETDSFAPPERAVALIADLHPALVVAELPDVGDYLSHVRSDPATRRLTVIGVGTGDAAMQRAAGVKVPLFTPDAFTEALPHVLAQYASVYAQTAELSAQCEGSPPPLVVKGLHEFNTGEYFECHETLEHAWNEEKGPVREVYRAILQVGVAYLQITRRNYNGARKMFLRSVQWFAPLPDRCQGIDIAGLWADVAVVRAALEELGPERIGEFDRALLKPIRFEQH